MGSVREWRLPTAVRSWPAAARRAARFCPPDERPWVNKRTRALKRNGSYSGVNETFAPLPFYWAALRRQLIPGAADLLPRLCGLSPRNPKRIPSAPNLDPWQNLSPSVNNLPPQRRLVGKQTGRERRIFCPGCSVSPIHKGFHWLRLAAGIWKGREI